MPSAPLPTNEDARLKALQCYDVLDSPAEDAFDELAYLAAHVCRTRSALVTLVDAKRQWFKARWTFDAPETARELAFCAHTILQRDVLEVSDATTDPRFADNSLVTGPPHIRFYAGAPLTTPAGFAIGSLAVIDYQPHHLDEGQRRALVALSHQVVTQLDLRRRLADERRLLRERSERAVADLEAEKRTLVERFDLVARATNDAVWDWDLASQALWWNQGFETLFGHQGAAIAQTVDSWMSLVHPDDQGRLGQGLHAVIDGAGAFWADEYRFRRHDGTYADVLDRGYVIRDRDGAAVRMIGAMVDLSERKRALEQVRQSEERYRELVEDIRELIVTVSADGVITSVNRAAESTLGAPRASWHGRPFVPLVHELDRALAAGLFERALRGEKPPACELRLITSAPAAVSLEFTFTPRFAGDRVVGVLGVGRDITERKRLEEQLRQSQKLEAIGQLSGGVAHDFNNLLTVIQCNAMLLVRNAAKPGAIHESADQIMHACERAANLTRQLLMVSRKQAMQPTILDLNDVAGNLTRMLQRIIGENIHMRSEYAAVMPPLRGDVGMLEQVLLNLVINARDAMPRGGTLTIATSVVTLDEAAARRRPEVTAGPCVCLRVSDTGAGIAAEVLPHVFEPFFTTKPVGKGTGLGLSTVHGIVKQHAGWIDIATEPGRGTTFEVWLPVPVIEPGRTVTARTGAAAVDGSLAGHETILVVEDEDIVRGLVVQILQRHGYTVLQAASGVAALEIWQRHRDQIDLLLTDLVMPAGTSGCELADRLRRDRPELEVIYTSGYGPELAGHQEELVEGLDFLQKPYHPTKLAQTVRNRLDHRLTGTRGRPEVTRR